MPPRIGANSEESLAERIQAAFPSARVVKTLNTMNASLMVEPAQLASGDHTVFVSRDQAGAKATVGELLRSFGWRDIIDLGDLATARGTELLLPIWLSLMVALGLPRSSFQFKVVR
jgi:predicted dinucleotide-binding enzyme